MLGFVSSSAPIEVLFFSPPEIPLANVLPIRVSAHVVSPRSSISLLTLSILY